MKVLSIQKLLGNRIMPQDLLRPEVGRALARQILQFQAAENASSEPSAYLCLSFTGIEMIGTCFLQEFLKPLIQSNLEDKSVCQIIISNFSNEVKEAICSMIALHLYRTKPKQKEYGIPIFQDGKLSFLGPMGKAVKATWEYLESKSDQSHTVQQVAMNRERSRSSCARHLQVLKRLGLLQRQKRKNECIKYWIGFSEGEPDAWEDFNYNDTDIIDLSGFAEINERLRSGYRAS